MAYQIISFDGVALPLYNPRQDHSGASVDSSLRGSVGGVYDYYGATKRNGKKQTPSITGIYWGESYYLVDESGVFLTDESGVLLTTEDGSGDLANQVDALRAKIGVQGPLVRTRMGDGMRQFITATLLGVPHQQITEDREFKAELTCNFESAMATWHRETVSTSTATMTVGSASLVVENSGNVTIDDAVITITATSTITSLRIVRVLSGIDLSWAGTLTAGQSLVIDCGLMTIRNNGVDAFSGLTRNVGHTAKGWLPIVKDVQTWTITSSAVGTFQVSYYDQWQ